MGPDVKRGGDLLAADGIERQAFDPSIAGPAYPANPGVCMPKSCDRSSTLIDRMLFPSRPPAADHPTTRPVRDRGRAWLEPLAPQLSPGEDPGPPNGKARTPGRGSRRRASGTIRSGSAARRPTPRSRSASSAGRCRRRAGAWRDAGALVGPERSPRRRRTFPRGRRTRPICWSGST